ncbi:MAG TPA: permease-like cell division protein FtsX [Bacteroidota bacterium]|nr:permease-like cell division protein FtsX [Bacteroidota bacterium]
MQFGYVMKEGFSGFRRAKLSMFAAVFAISVSLLLLSFFAILLVNANSIVESLRNKVEMEAFIGDQLSPDDVTNLKIQIELLDGIKEARFISKEEAATIFKEEFGEDIYKVLNFNPLPASFKIFLKDGYKTAKKAEVIYNQVKALRGVDDVIYRKQLLDMLDNRGMTFLWITFGIGVFIALSSIILVANTIRLAIYAKRKIIQTMKLIGATRMFIRIPFMIEGLVQGVIGGLVAAGVVFIVFNYLERWMSVSLSDFVHVEPLYYGLILGVGCSLGLIGSLVAVRRFIGEGVAGGSHAA